MSEPINDGGSAFPLTTAWASPDTNGMSLRDWLAGQAISRIADDFGDDCDGYISAVSRRAYKLADAMIAERRRNANEPASPLS